MPKKQTTYSPKNFGYKVPENYFKEFKVESSSVAKRNNKTQETAGFKTPDNYFEEFIIKIPKQKQSRQYTIVKNVAYQMAGIAALLVFSLWIIKQTQQNYAYQEELSKTEIDLYFEQNGIDLEYLPIDYTTDIPERISEKLNQINPESIEQYLSENTEISMLLEN